jgi:hypothetical protein
LGYQILEPVLRASTTSNTGDATSLDANAVSPATDLVFRVNNLIAYGALTDEGFVLKKGSQLSRTNTDSIPGKLASIKERLLAEGALATENDRLVATSDILLSSSSYAAAIVAGTSRSGPQSWKTTNGKTLKELEDASLPDA